jgi:hypothetical protein
MSSQIVPIYLCVTYAVLSIFLFLTIRVSLFECECNAATAKKINTMKSVLFVKSSYIYIFLSSNVFLKLFFCSFRLSCLQSKKDWLSFASCFRFYCSSSFKVSYKIKYYEIWQLIHNLVISDREIRLTN